MSYELLCMRRVQQRSLIVLTAAILSGLSIISMIIPQTVYAYKDEGNPSSSRDDCKSDELPASIDGKVRCMGQGECYSEDFEVDGKEVKHCNFMMNTN